MKYTIKHQIGSIRCAWCWKSTGDNERYAMIEAKTVPHLVLRFHVHCLDTYRNVSGCDPETFSKEWTPERIEMLRMSSGLTMAELSKLMRISYSRFRSIMDGAEPITYTVSQYLKTIAIKFGFERSTGIDWSDPDAVFCLRMSQRWTERKMAEQVGCKLLRICSWQRSGVPARAVKAWAKLNTVANRVGFDGGEIIRHRMWTKEYLQKLVIDSGKPDVRWHRVVGCSAASFYGWKSGRRGINRAAAWRLTRAAVSFGLPLPPEGDYKEKVSARRGRTAEKLKSIRGVWTIEMLRVLGTKPDSELVNQIGKSRMAIRIMRALIGVSGIDPRRWDGIVRTQMLSDEELLHRQKVAREKHRLEVNSTRNEFDRKVAS